VGASVIGGRKKINVRINIRPKETTEPFSNSSLKEPLINATFNNDSRQITIVKGCVFNNGSFKEPLLNDSAVFWCYGSLF
jgi:hypothetical protein